MSILSAEKENRKFRIDLAISKKRKITKVSGFNWGLLPLLYMNPITAKILFLSLTTQRRVNTAGLKLVVRCRLVCLHPMLECCI